MIRQLLTQMASRWGVSLYEHSVNSNHLHIVLRAKHRVGFQNFLRVFSGQISMKLTGAKKGKPLPVKSFWDSIPYTRICDWGRAFSILKAYVLRNQLEAVGAISYVTRKTKVRRE